MTRYQFHSSFCGAEDSRYRFRDFTGKQHIRGSFTNPYNNYNNVLTDVPGEQESRDVSNAYQVPLAY